MWARRGDMRGFELGSKGEMQDRLNALVLAGDKRATAGLWNEDYAAEDEPIDEVGERQALLDDDGRLIAVIEVTRVDEVRFIDVTWEFAQAEGEGFTSVDDWRAGHREYWTSEGVEIDDDTPVVCVWFEVVDEVGGVGD
jgi:uncharacterized protein YhfF